jgi:hypothetical protein
MAGSHNGEKSCVNLSKEEMNKKTLRELTSDELVIVPGGCQVT